MAEGGFVSNLRTGVFSKGGRKFLLFSGVAVAAVVAMMVFSGGHEPPASSQIGAVPTVKSFQGGSPVSEAYATELNTANVQRIARAKEEGGSAQPTVIVGPAQGGPPIIPVQHIPNAPSEPGPPVDPLLVSRPPVVNTNPPRAPIQQSIQERNPLVEAMAQQMRSIADEKPGNALVTYLYEHKDVVGESERDRQLQTVAGSGAGGLVQGALDPSLPLPGTILYAETIGEANSDAPGPVLVQILQGPLAGARLIGTFRVAQEALVLEFERMTVPEDRQARKPARVVQLKAVAVDTEKLGTAMATDVDRRLFEKVAFGFSAAFLQGFGQAIAQSGTTVTRDLYGTTYSTPRLSTKEQLLVAGGAASGQVGATLNQVFGNRPTTVKVRAGTPVGILFL
ncbi:DotG/IcmE/VirB10 family protein [Methylobacterium radiotolerans]|uniref:DotG/IcmE/VirB10 family protein n=1 Tax=Methylobacterium radiotolerans TaxID=31998 RepID=UPI0038D0DF1E